MYTMRPEEVKDWNRSLILREINVPDQIKDELIMMSTINNPLFFLYGNIKRKNSQGNVLGRHE